MFILHFHECCDFAFLNHTPVAECAALQQSRLCMKLESFILCPEGFPGNFVWCSTIFGKNTPAALVSRCMFPTPLAPTQKIHI